MRSERDDYVRPVTRADESRPEWLETWPFRLVTLLVLAAIAFGVYYLIFDLHFTVAGNSQG